MKPNTYRRGSDVAYGVHDLTTCNSSDEEGPSSDEEATPRSSSSSTQDAPGADAKQTCKHAYPKCA
jgi:hypothetical protein